MSQLKNCLVIACWSNVWQRPKEFLTVQTINQATVCRNLGAFATMPTEMRHFIFDKLSGVCLFMNRLNILSIKGVICYKCKVHYIFRRKLMLYTDYVCIIYEKYNTLFFCSVHQLTFLGVPQRRAACETKL